MSGEDMRALASNHSITRNHAENGRLLFCRSRGRFQELFPALLRTEVKNPRPVLQPEGQPGVHVHPAYRIFDHILGRAFYSTFGSPSSGSAQESGKDPFYEPNAKYKKERTNQN